MGKTQIGFPKMKMVEKEPLQVLKLKYFIYLFSLIYKNKKFYNPIFRTL